MNASGSPTNHLHRLEAISELVGSVTHELNNLLTCVIGYADELLLWVDASDDQQLSLRQIRDAGQRAAALSHQLLTFTRVGPLTPVDVDGASLLRAVANQMSAYLRAEVRITCEAPDRLPLRVDALLLQHIVESVILAGQEALPNGGDISLTLSVRHEGLPGFARLTIADDAAGPIAAERTRRLAAVSHLVHKLGGGFTVNPGPGGRGTSCHLYLPLSAPPSEPTHDDGSVAAGTILLVDDDLAVRTIASRLLRGAGHRVVTASSSSAAIAEVRRTPDAIHVVVTDISMPDMSGPALLEEIAQIAPATRGVLMSGAVFGATGEQPMRSAPVVAKPFPPGALESAVARALNSRGPLPGESA